MSLVAISGNASGTGTLTIAAPNTNSNYTLNLPAAAGTVMVSGNMPAFSAYLGSSQTISSGATTKVQCNTEEFDTANCYDNATNYRFTPNVAGYYQVNCAAQEAAGASVILQINIYKNGSLAKKSSYVGGVAYYACTSSVLIYMNGTTDYLEFYLYASASAVLVTGTQATYFQASLARSA
jgi:hypothetical protein